MDKGEQITVPFIDLARTYQKHRDEYLEAADDALQSGQMFQGKHVNLLEENIKWLTNRKYAISVGSCTDALFFALKALDIGTGDEVIIPPFSFISTLSAVLRADATPVFVDIDPDTCMIDCNEVEKVVNARTRAIIPVQLFGQTMDPDPVEQIAAQYGLYIVEDAAQGLGSSFRSRPAGSLGDISCLSFDPMKTAGSFGPGGMVTTDDKQIESFIRSIKRHGKQEGGHEMLGYNSDLPEVQASMINVRLKYLNDDIGMRDNLADDYGYTIERTNHIETLKPLPAVCHTWHKFVVRSNFRDALQAYLKEHGIQTRIHYAKPLYREPLFTGEYRLCANAEEAANKVLSLPLFSTMTFKEFAHVCDVLERFIP